MEPTKYEPEGYDGPEPFAYTGGYTVSLEQDEWQTLLRWINQHHYGQQADETLDAWRERTGPVAYAYSLIAEAANPGFTSR